jgi:hypothetical protein
MQFGNATRISSATLLIFIAHAFTTAAQERSAPGPIAPVEPVSAIVEAFKTHDVVALVDAHGDLQNHAFRLALIRDPRFTSVVNDIVVELGNARYQDFVDRFVRGEDVPLASLRRAWQDTTVTTAANNYAMIQELFETVRVVNGGLPRDRQLRVLLADPPIDWDVVRDRAAHQRWLALRDSYPAALIQVEVLAKRRKALLLYGFLHFQRKNIASNYDMQTWEAQTIVSILESTTPTKVFTIWELDPARVAIDVGTWPVPSIALVRGTAVGAADFAPYAGPVASARVSVRDGKFVPVPRDEWRSMRTEEQIDALLYLGPSTARTSWKSHEIPPGLCAESDFLAMQFNRMQVAGVPRVESERLKEYCTAVLSQ